jgi:hypothetical protein
MATSAGLQGMVVMAQWANVTDQRNYMRLSKKIFHRGG